jgi:hypothetical protein
MHSWQHYRIHKEIVVGDHSYVDYFIITGKHEVHIKQVKQEKPKRKEND